MGTNNLSTKSSGDTVIASDPNQYKTALVEDLVPRNSSGVPTNEAGGLGTDTYEWETLYTREINLDGTINQRGTMTTQTYTSSDTWEAPTGVHRVFVIAAGAGGNGDASGEKGGGGGGVALAWVDVEPGATYTVTIASGDARFVNAATTELVMAYNGGAYNSSDVPVGGSFAFDSSVVGWGARGGNAGAPGDGQSNDASKRRAESGYRGIGGLSNTVAVDSECGGGGGYSSGADGSGSGGGGGGGYTAASGTSGGAAGLILQYYLPSGVTDPN